MSDALDVVKRFESLMLNDLPDDEGAAGTPEERFQQVLQLIDPAFELPVAGALPYGGRHIGPEGFIEMGKTFAETWNIIENPRPEFVDAGDGRVIALYSPTFESRATGRSVSFRMVEVITVRDGKLVELVPYYFDTLELVDAFSTDAPAGVT
jgi:hypothetical protein